MIEKKKEGSKNSRLKGLSDLISGGKWITKNLNFFLFLSLLTVIYIANGHMADKTIRNINKTQLEIKDLQYEYKTIKGEVMFRSEETQIENIAAPYGLKISKEVPQRLQIEKVNNKK